MFVRKLKMSRWDEGMQFFEILKAYLFLTKKSVREQRTVATMPSFYYQIFKAIDRLF